MPAQAIAEVIKQELGEMTKSLADKILLTSIAATASITTAQAAEVIPVTTMDIATWVMTDYALAISMIAGAALIIERCQTIVYKAIDRRRQKKAVIKSKTT